MPHAPSEDKLLLVQEGLRTHASDLCRFVRGRVAPAEVEDVMQSAALRALERADSLKDASRIRPWLYQLHRNVVVDAIRKRASHGRVLEAQSETHDTASVQPDTSCGCSLAITRTLVPSYAAVLTLVDLQGVSRQDAADALGISVNNASARLHRARKALRKALFEHCGVQSLRDCVDCRCVTDGCCPTA